MKPLIPVVAIAFLGLAASTAQAWEKAEVDTRVEASVRAHLADLGFDSAGAIISLDRAKSKYPGTFHNRTRWDNHDANQTARVRWNVQIAIPGQGDAVIAGSTLIHGFFSGWESHNIDWTDWGTEVSSFNDVAQRVVDRHRPIREKRQAAAAHAAKVRAAKREAKERQARSAWEKQVESARRLGQDQLHDEMRVLYGKSAPPSSAVWEMRPVLNTREPDIDNQGYRFRATALWKGFEYDGETTVMREGSGLSVKSRTVTRTARTFRAKVRAAIGR
jgi:hypothetical protein